MGQYNTILYQKDEMVPNIVYITLNRPDKSNAISIGPDKMTGEVQDALKKVNDDDEVKVVIFRANGKDFSGGFDLSEVYRVYGGGPGIRPPQATRLSIDEDQIVGMGKAILSCRKVTMAQVHGWCVEAGMYIPENCDISIAAKNTKFAHRGQRLAFGGMLTRPLYAMMGHTKKIVELLITGRTISGEEAEQIGIITKAVEPEELQEETYNLAKAICFLPYDAIVMGKMARKHTYEALGIMNMAAPIVYHTLATNLHYRPEEREAAFIRDREKMGAREAFHKLHQSWEEALNKTKHFKSYSP